MARILQQVVVQLCPEDASIVHAIAEACGVSRTEVMRWAIRYYGIHGPWTDSTEDRLDALGGARRLVTGPGMEDVA